MKTLIAAVGGLMLVAGSSTYAADNGSRTYPDPSCSDRNANSENCLVQDGPSRRGTTAQTPPAKGPSATPGTATGASAGKGVAGSGTSSGGASK
jgi:hypothetical protein